MTPSRNLDLPIGAQPANSNLYNQVSSSGMAARETMMEDQEQPQTESLVDQATKRFGAVFQHLEEFIKSYPGSDKEAQMVKDAMAKLLNAVVNRINESGGNSTY